MDNYKNPENPDLEACINLAIDFSSERYRWENAMMKANLVANADMSEQEKQTHDSLEYGKYEGMTKNEIAKEYFTIFTTFVSPKYKIEEGNEYITINPSQYAGFSGKIDFNFVNDNHCDETCEFDVGFELVKKFTILKENNKWLISSVTEWDFEGNWEESIL